MVDTRDLKSLDSNVVWVRVPPEAPKKHTPKECVFAYRPRVGRESWSEALMSRMGPKRVRWGRGDFCEAKITCDRVLCSEVSRRKTPIRLSGVSLGMGPKT